VFFCNGCFKIGGSILLHRMTSARKLDIGFLVEKVDYWLCPHCNEWIKYKSNWRKHIKRQHEKKKQHVCSICASAFGGITELKRHQRNIHREGRGFSCKYCSPTSFSTPGHCTAHMFNHHGHRARDQKHMARSAEKADAHLKEE